MKRGSSWQKQKSCKNEAGKVLFVKGYPIKQLPDLTERLASLQG